MFSPTWPVEKEQKNNKTLFGMFIFSFGCIYFIFEIFNDFISKENFEININIIEFILIFLSYLLSGAIWSNYMSSNYEGKFSLYFYNWSYSQLGKYFLSGILSVSIRLNQKLQKSKFVKNIFISSNKTSIEKEVNSIGCKFIYREEKYCNNIIPWSEMIYHTVKSLPIDDDDD